MWICRRFFYVIAIWSDSSIADDELVVGICIGIHQIKRLSLCVVDAVVVCTKFISLQCTRMPMMSMMRIEFHTNAAMGHNLSWIFQCEHHPSPSSVPLIDKWHSGHRLYWCIIIKCVVSSVLTLHCIHKKPRFCAVADTSSPQHIIITELSGEWEAYGHSDALCTHYIIMQSRNCNSYSFSITLLS